jgi:hypothetical protein
MKTLILDLLKNLLASLPGNIFQPDKKAPLWLRLLATAVFLLAIWLLWTVAGCAVRIEGAAGGYHVETESRFTVNQTGPAVPAILRDDPANQPRTTQPATASAP